MKKTPNTSLRVALVAALLSASPFVFAAVSADEAAKLKTELTPFGAEKAGNKDGTIPAWTGGDTTVPAGYNPRGKRVDPFASEKPLYSVTAANMDKYADKLNDGTKAMLKKYPSYRIDVYPTHRTAAAPQYVYDNTFKNATRAKLEGVTPKGAIGGAPFPIPKTGEELMWNHLLHWRGETFHEEIRAYLVTADGKRVLTVEGNKYEQMPYYAKDASLDKLGDYWTIRLLNVGPPIRAGEAIVGRENLDPDKTQVWVYLTGQRRVRKLPNGCCDTPTPATAGVMSFDEINVFSTAETLKRFDWKIVGKKEMLIPYNSNRSVMAAKDTDLVGEHHLNPDNVRWELHRVWVVEATLKAGQRHQAAKSRYYVDEDSWVAVLGDRWDAKGQLWKTLWELPLAMPDIPATAPLTFGYYDLAAGTWFVNGVVNEKAEHHAIVPRMSDSSFTPDAMAGEGVR